MIDIQPPCFGRPFRSHNNERLLNSKIGKSEQKKKKVQTCCHIYNFCGTPNTVHSHTHTFIYCFFFAANPKLFLPQT